MTLLETERPEVDVKDLDTFSFTMFRCSMRDDIMSRVMILFSSDCSSRCSHCFTPLCLGPC